VRRTRVVVTYVAGTALLGVSLATRPGSARFYGLTMGVAATWLTGALGAGPYRLGRKDILVPMALGAGAFGAFYGCALVARRIPLLRRAISGVLRYEDQGSSPLVLLTTLTNGIAEEVFFRGAVYEVAGKHPVAMSTVVYALSTTATRNPALVLASVVMGTLFGLQRSATGGILAPMVTHVTWSALMLRLLPRLFQDTPVQDMRPTGRLTGGTRPKRTRARSPRRS
jgi:membrane protease YdiL (CAAX protease family)